MSPTEHPPKTPSPRTGLFALLGALLRIKGTSALKITPSVNIRTDAAVCHANEKKQKLTAAFVSLPLNTTTLGTLAVIFCFFSLAGFAALGPTAANAALSRKFERQLTGTCEKAGEVAPECAGSKFVPFPSNVNELGGVAVDQAGDLWVGQLPEGPGGTLSEFGPAVAGNVFLGTSALEVHENALHEKEISLPSALAVEHSSPEERFYIAGETTNVSKRSPGVKHVEVFDSAGKFTEVWEDSFNEASEIAIDNSTEAIEDPSACGTLPLSPGECFVYVAEEGEHGGLRKFDPDGKEEPFTFDKECEETACGYVSGDQITGIPGDPTGVFQEAGLNSLTVDAKGDIYLDNSEVHAVYEYAPSGEFMREFKTEEAPLLEGKLGEQDGIAIDPASKRLLVTVGNEVGGVKLGAVDEFATEGPEAGKFVAQITETKAGGKLEKPVGVAVDSQGDVYVTEEAYQVGLGATGGRNAIDVWSALGLPTPSVKIGEASGRTPSGAVLNGSVDPEGHSVSECRFQYIEEASYLKDSAAPEHGFEDAAANGGGEEPCSPAATQLVANDEYQPVSASITNVVSGTTYRYRLVAKSEGEAQSEVRAFTAPHKPAISAPRAVNVSSAYAELDAQIDPLGASTTYHFEYDTRPYSGEETHGTSVPAPDDSLGSGGPTGSSQESVSQHIGSLAADTTYYFRAVATNEIGSEYGEQQTFTTLPETPTGLPDHRAYELVTPANKQGGSDMFAEAAGNGEYKNEKSVGTPSQDGDGFLLETKSPFGEFPGAGTSAYVFRREPAKGQWGYTSLADPSLGVQNISRPSGFAFEPFSLSRVAFTDGVGSLLSEAGERLTDVVGAPGGPYTTLHRDPPFHNIVESEVDETKVVGASHDLSHVVFDVSSNDECSPVPAAEEVAEGNVVCEWDGGVETLEDGEVQPELKLVSLAPGSETKAASTCGALLGAGRDFGRTRGAVSAGGGTVFFTAPEPPVEQGGSLALGVRAAGIRRSCMHGWTGRR